MTPKEREAQAQADKLLAKLPSKYASLQAVRDAVAKTVASNVEPKTVRLKEGERPRQAELTGELLKASTFVPQTTLGARAMVADASLEGVLWGASYTEKDGAPPPAGGEVLSVAANPPTDPKLVVEVRPGRTTWAVESGWAQAGNVRPLGMRIELYDASNSQLVARRLTSRDMSVSGEANGFCLQWLPDSSLLPHTCEWWFSDGVVAGMNGKNLYAKVSFATQFVSHYMAVPGQPNTYQQYYAPTAWTAASNTPTGPAVYTPGIPDGMGGSCTCTYQNYMADPVNTASGAVTESVTDVSVQGKGPQFTLMRSYRSDDKTAGGLLGKGWALSFESRLAVDSKRAVLVDADGAQIIFTKNGDGSFATPKPVRFTLAAVSGGYAITALDGSIRFFDGDGRLTGVRDSDGRGLALSYDSSRLTKVVDAAGRSAAFTVDAATGRLSQVELADGRKVTYTYVGGQLATLTGVDGGLTKYTYDAGGRLATIVDANGKVVTQNTYDPTSGRITRQIDASGKTYTFTWTPQENAPAGSGRSNMTDPSGGIWTDVYEAGVLLRHEDPLGHSPSRGYDQYLNVVKSQDANYQQTAATYDSHGNPSSATLGGATRKWSFDGADRLALYTDGRKNTTAYEYDGTSTRITTTKAPSGDTKYTYTADGQLETVTTPDSRTISYAYDEAGHLISTTNATGEKTTYTYDVRGQLKTETDPRGNVKDADASKYTTVYDYWPSGKVKTVTDPQGHVTAYTYDANGNTKSVTDALKRVTAYEYDNANRVTKMSAPGGRVTTTTYDDRGNVASVTDPTGAKTTYVYDGANRLVSQTSPRGNETGADATNYTTTYGYDNNGNLTKTVDPTGALTSTAFDAFNRPTLVTDALGQATKTEYDAVGNITKSTDALNKSTTFTYTPANLQATATNPLGKTTWYGYDSDGHRTSATSPGGAKSTWSFDADGRLKSQTDARGNATGADPAKFTTTYGYDAAGNQSMITNPLGERTTTEYNALNQPVSVTNPLGKVTATEYDEIGRISNVTAPDSGMTSYSYNTAGDLATRKDPNGHVTTYGYDDAGRQAAITDPLGRKQTIRYDPDGNPTTRTNARGVTATTTFDARNLPSGTTYTDNTPPVSQAYDAIGQRRSVIDTTGTRTFDYDKAGRLTAVTPAKGKGAFTYTYDEAGQLTSRTGDGANPPGVVTGLGGFCLDVANGWTADGTAIQLWTCNGSPAQQYTLQGGQMKVSGKCVTAVGTANKSAVQLVTCGSAQGQQWTVKSDGSLQNGQSGKCLDIPDGKAAAGAKLQIYDCNTSAAQHWTWSPPRPPGVVTGLGGFCLDVANGWTADGTAIQLWTCNGSPAQQYTLQGGQMKVSGKCVTAVGTANKSAVQLVTCGSAQGQQWTVKSDGSLQNGQSGKCLDIPDGKAAAGAKLQIYDCNTSAAQHWTPPAPTGPGTTTQYTYDDDSRRISETTSEGTVTYDYDPAGHLTTTKLPAANGYTEQRSYDNAGRLITINSAKGTSTLASWSQTFDAMGQPTRIDVTRAGKPATYQYYTYDPTGRLLTDCSSILKADTCPDASSATTFSYDSVGNRKTQNKAGTTTTYTYDNADQLSQAVTSSATRSYTYDADGNQTGAGDDTFTYDANNHLTSAASNGAKYSYTYDADGNRATAAKDSSGLQRTTAWDINNALPLAAAEYTSSGTLNAQYQYNPLGQIQAETTDAGTFYHHHDLIGSVTDLTNVNGTLQTSYTYTAFGEITQANSATQPPTNPFTYTGEYREPTTSVAGYYLRARNYTPDIGRFTSRDPYDPGQETAYSTAYGYVENAPTNRTDPSGMCSIWADIKDFFNGRSRLGTKSDCNKEDRKTVQEGGAAAVVKGSADALSKDLVQQFGGAGVGIADGMSFGAFSYMDPYAACLRQTDGYNFGLYGSMVPFPLSGGPRAATEGGLWAAARVNLPSWKAVAVDMVHVVERHTADGKIYKQSGIKTKFPDSWSPEKIEKAILNAYRFGRSVRTQGSRIQLQGMTDGLVIEMWFDRAANLIETAYPIWR
ncbi:ricin-type beta-trefoil lectin domain protein [Streptomyces sp. NPDC055808]